MIPDQKLAELAPFIEQRLAQAANEITPEDFRGLIGDPGASILRSTMQVVQADSMSVWIADIPEDYLVVTHTEPDPAFVGWKQPVGEGLISLAFASEQCLCENRVHENEAHSKKADQALSQDTAALIATPFYFGGALQGVISCVQLRSCGDASDPPGFTATALNKVRRLSSVLERLTNYRLLTTLLDIEI